MPLITPQSIPETGRDPVYVAASAGGDTVAPAAGLALHVKNGGAAAITVTVVRPGSSYGQANPDVPVTIAAAGAQFIRVPPEFADAATAGNVSITYSAVTSVTVALLQVQ